MVGTQAAGSQVCALDSCNSPPVPSRPMFQALGKRFPAHGNLLTAPRGRYCANPLLEMRKLRLGDVKSVAQRDPPRKWWSRSRAASRQSLCS